MPPRAQKPSTKQADDDRKKQLKKQLKQQVR